MAQMGRCAVIIENNNKIKMSRFFVVPGNRQPLLGMTDIETLGILTVNCNAIEMKDADSPGNCQAHMNQEIDVTEEYYTNTDNVSKFEMKIWQQSLVMIIITKYFLPDPNSDNDKKESVGNHTGTTKEV